jgi:hypothetical protein
MRDGAATLPGRAGRCGAAVEHSRAMHDGVAKLNSRVAPFLPRVPPRHTGFC